LSIFVCIQLVFKPLITFYLFPTLKTNNDRSLYIPTENNNLKDGMQSCDIALYKNVDIKFSAHEAFLE